MTPKQSAFLQENTDQMMWEAADQNSIGIVRSEETGELNPERIVGKNDPVEEALNEEKPQGLQKNSIASASGISDSGKSSGSSKSNIQYCHSILPKRDNILLL